MMGRRSNMTDYRIRSRLRRSGSQKSGAHCFGDAQQMAVNAIGPFGFSKGCIRVILADIETASGIREEDER